MSFSKRFASNVLISAMKISILPNTFSRNCRDFSAGIWSFNESCQWPPAYFLRSASSQLLALKTESFIHQSELFSVVVSTSILSVL